MTAGRVIVVGGPTASGKSALALALAEDAGGTVINADSMQVYRDAPVLTAQPGPADRARAPHELYGILDADDRCSAGRWRDLARAAIDRAAAAGRVPIVVGGTGLYLRALIRGFHAIPPVPPAVRARLAGELETEGAAALHARLARGDPAAAARIRAGDRQRIVRALEVLEHTGRPLSAWQAGARAAAAEDLDVLAVALSPPREDLYRACEARFAWMLDHGAVDETSALLAAGLPADAPLRKAVGFAPIARFLAGEIDRETLLETGRRDTRRYAKRQTTWFRHQFVAQIGVHTKFSEKEYAEIFPKISSFLLTDH